MVCWLSHMRVNLPVCAESRRLVWYWGVCPSRSLSASVSQILTLPSARRPGLAPVQKPRTGADRGRAVDSRDAGLAGGTARSGRGLRLGGHRRRPRRRAPSPPARRRPAAAVARRHEALGPARGARREARQQQQHQADRAEHHDRRGRSTWTPSSPSRRGAPKAISADQKYMISTARLCEWPISSSRWCRCPRSAANGDWPRQVRRTMASTRSAAGIAMMVSGISSGM